MKKRGSIYSVGVLAGFAALSPVMSSAQVLEEVMVTAQKRSERLVDVPVSITAITADGLEKAGIDRFDNLGQVSVGTQISRVGIFVQPAIRGVTNKTVGPGLENNIAIYIDGFYQPDSVALGSDMVNVENIQVLKGPQGALYGRNAMGGAILATTRSPNMDEQEFEVEIHAGNLDDRRFRAYASVPLSDTMAFNIGGYWRENDGYIKDIDTGKDAAPYENKLLRAKLRLEPSENLVATIGFNYDYRSDPRGLTYTFVDNEFPAFFNRTNKKDRVSHDPLPEFWTRQREGTIKLEWHSEWGDLTSYTSYLDQKEYSGNDFDGTKDFELQFAGSKIPRKTVQQAIDFAMSPTDTIDLVLGAHYFDDAGSTDPSTVIAAARLFRIGTTNIETEAYSVFADATFELSRGLYFTAGVRYSDEEKTIESFRSFDVYMPLDPPVQFAPTTSETFSDVTARASLRYEIDDNSSVYFSYNQGFKSGAFNTIGQSVEALTTPVDPETVDAFEIGYKLAEDRYTFEAAAFLYDFEDLQVSSLQTINGSPGTFVTNAASAEIYGAEVSLSSALTEALNARLGVGYTHAEYEDFKDASVTLVIDGANVGGQIQDLTGEQLARAPEWTVTFGMDYTIPVGEGEVVIAGSGYYSSDYTVREETLDASGNSRFDQGSYATFAANVDWALGNGFSIGAYVNNITDERIKIVSAANRFGDYVVYGDPRTYGVKVEYIF